MWLVDERCTGFFFFFFLNQFETTPTLYNSPLKSVRVDPVSSWKWASIFGKRRLFLIPLPRRGVGWEGGKWGNLGVLGEQAHGEKSQFGKQRWNHNLWSPLCPCRPVIPTAIKGKEREGHREVQQITPTSRCTRAYWQMYYILCIWKGTEEKTVRVSKLRFTQSFSNSGSRGFQRTPNKMKKHLIWLLAPHLTTILSLYLL